MTGTVSEPIAIIGMSVLFPGAHSLESYWRNLVDGHDAITDVPANRWKPVHYDPEHADRPDRVYCRRGGFVDELADFDALRFGTVPTSIPSIEPEQLLALRVAAEAIDDAGGRDALPAPDRVGVIMGRGGNGSSALVTFYLRVWMATELCNILHQLLPEVSQSQLDLIRDRINSSVEPIKREDVIGLVPNLTASRIANRLNLSGPAYTVDAACASSLIALDHGVGELLRGRLDAVVVGGVHHFHDIGYWSLFNQLRALSVRGEIRPFDASADGLLIGEGTGVVVLKRLSDALRDGHRVHAVIRGTGVSSDGRAASLFNPESAGQAIAVRRAWVAAGLDPTADDALGLLEAHGTATPTGDAAELATMARVFGRGGDGPRAVIGSVKSMIGHTMPAAGMAGLVKAALAVSRGVLLPTLHCENPRAELEQTRFAPIAAARPWEDPVGPRRAAVNAFGFGGINAHVIVEQPPDAPASRRHRSPAGPPQAFPGTPPTSVREPDRLVLLGAADREAVARILDGDDHAVRALGTALATNHGVDVDGHCRLGIVDPTTERIAIARRVVANATPWRGGRDVWFSPRPMLADSTARVAFVFPGLEREFSPRLDDVVGHFKLSSDLGGEPLAPEDTGSAGLSKLDVAWRAAGLLRAGQLLHDALGRIGVVPDAVAGYSMGEWTAGVVAGVLDERSLLDYGLLLELAVDVEGLSLAAVGLSGSATTEMLADHPGVVLSHDNSPTQSIVCGPGDEVDRLVSRLRAGQVVCRILPFVTTLHTPYMAELLEPLRAIQVRPTVARVPMWSATLAAPSPTEPAALHELFLRNLTEPVRLRSLVESMYDAGVRVFLQTGPGQLASLVHDNLREREHLAMPVNVSHRSGLDQLRRVATALWVEGADPDLRALEPPRLPQPASLTVHPATAVQHGDVGKPSRTVRLQLGNIDVKLGDDAHELLGGVDAPRAVTSVSPVPATSGALAALHRFGPGSPAAELAALLEHTADSALTVLSAAHRPAVPASHQEVLRVSLAEMPHLRDHCFFVQPDEWPIPADRWPVVPATAIIQHLIDAVERLDTGQRVIGVRAARFHRWTLAEPALDVDITTRSVGPAQVSATFGPYAGAKFDTAPDYPTDPPPVWSYDAGTEIAPTILARQMYAERMLFHGPRYHGLEAVHALGERHVRGSIRALAAPGAIFDSGWHLVGNWLLTTQPDRTVAYPVSVGSIRYFGPPPAPGQLIQTVCRITDIDDSKLVSGVQFAVDGRVWAQADDCVHRRFDTHPQSRLMELFPGRHAVSVRQPEGWTLLFDCWTDLMTQNFIAHQTLGTGGVGDYDRQMGTRRKPWLLGRLAVKDAVRFRLWDDGAGELFPIEVRVSNDQSGRPRVDGWPGRPLPELAVSLAHTKEVAVAMAVPHRDTGGVGIDVAEIIEPSENTVRLSLSDAERALLDALSATADDRTLWFARFWAAKEAVAKAEGTGFDGAPRRFAVSTATPTAMTVDVAGRTYRVDTREISNPPRLPSRRYVVAWTTGPQGTGPATASPS